jgi:hypothetical protein
MSEFRNVQVIEITIFKDNVREIKIEGGVWVAIYTKDLDAEPYLNACADNEAAKKYRDEILEDLATKGFHIFKDLRAEWDDEPVNEVAQEELIENE